MAAWIAENDGPFKHHLDRFKYPERFQHNDSKGGQGAGRSSPGWGGGTGNRAAKARGVLTSHPAGEASGPCLGDAGGEREHHREAALGILRRWNRNLEPGGWLLGEHSCLADWALLPFVRQFRRADPDRFDAEPQLEALQDWLGRFEASSALAAVMEPPWGLRQAWRSPRWLYHLALAEDWRQARSAGVYARSTRGLDLAEVGFIHASQAHQLAATYARFYGDAGPVVLLTIDPERLSQAGVAVRAEPAATGQQTSQQASAEGPGELFPHLYGPLPLEAVLTAEPYPP